LNACGAWAPDDPDADWFVLPGVPLALVDEPAAPAIAEPPSASAASAASPATTLVSDLNICLFPSLVRGWPGFAVYDACAVRALAPRSVGNG
jgi:hypothetical protein